LFGWKTGARYKVLGTFHQSRDEKFLLFDMSEAIRIIVEEPAHYPMDEDSVRRRVKRIRLFPESWEDSFGEQYYATQARNNMLRMEIEQSGKTEGVVCNLGDKGVTSAEEAGKQVDKIIREIVDGCK
jgi:hypothetical protein